MFGTKRRSGSEIWLPPPPNSNPQPPPPTTYTLPPSPRPTPKYKAWFLQNVVLAIFLHITIAQFKITQRSIHGLSIKIQKNKWYWNNNHICIDPFIKVETDVILIWLKTWCGTTQLAVQVILTHWGRDKMATISQTTISDSFSRMKMYEVHLIFHWSLFLRFKLTIFQHWSR